MSGKNLIVFFFVLNAYFPVVKAQPSMNLTVSSEKTANAFPLVERGRQTQVFIDTTDATVVRIAAEAFISDINSVTGELASLTLSTKNRVSSNAVIIGTLDHSSLISTLVKNKKLSPESIRGKWETFAIVVVDHPFRGVEKALVIAGSDRRGTAFGVFELSRMLGVSPWKWWADVTPAHKDEIYISGKELQGPPSVKYRGIFLNDEDWGLQPWAAKNMDTVIHDIGPNTYAHIFELLLRLKANFIWPAMHPCTKAFYYYPGNPAIADKYAIVVGSSHCEPLLRNNVFEWAENYEKEYGTKPGEWRYDVNQKQIYNYWEDRVKQAGNYESVFTVGMRGVHDGSMPGPKSKPEKVKLLERIIDDQRGLLTKHFNRSAADIPQIFCPYKEVLSLYQAGLNLPDDVTIVWSDDNHGYIRQLSDPAEQKRSGGSGVYYHLSYWGAPHDYLWLCSTSPSLVSYELYKAYQYGASRLWVVNVGDIKPAEMETEFTMDMAWNIDVWKPENAYQYVSAWASRTFGKEFSQPIADIKNEYYRLSQCAKPEHMGMLTFTDTVAEERLRDYAVLERSTDELYSKIPGSLRDAFYQLIYYPVHGAALMNQKMLLARKSMELAEKGDTLALDYARRSLEAFDKIKELTRIYNEDIAGGKWSGIMSWCPRNLEVFKMPEVATAEKIGEANEHSGNGKKMADIPVRQTKEKGIEGSSANSHSFSTKEMISVAAADYNSKKEMQGVTLMTIEGLGLGGRGITVFPITIQPVLPQKINEATSVDYKVNVTGGTHTIIVKCLPTQGIYKNRNLRYAISVNGDSIQIANVNCPNEDKTWAENVIRGFSTGTTIHHVKQNGEANLRLYFPDPGLVVNRIEIY